jgi:hypothetical protein
LVIKATQQVEQNNEIDICMGKDGSMHPMGFKQFLYDYCAFSVHEQKGTSASLFSSRRPKDEDEVHFTFLFRKKKERQNTEKAPLKPANAILHRKCGKRKCH